MPNVHLRCHEGRMRYAPTPVRLTLGGTAISLRVRSREGRMRYAPTPVHLIIGWGGDFFSCSLTWRAYAIRPYRFCQNRLGASKNCGRYFSTEIIDTSSYRYFLPAKIFTSSYRYFLVLQIEMVRRTGTFWCCKLKWFVVPVLFGVAN